MKPNSIPLDNLPRPPVFGVPDGYFDALPHRISARVAGTEGKTPAPLDFSLLDEAGLDEAGVGLLADMPKHHPFQVPDGYFDRLRIVAPVAAALPPRQVWRPFPRRVRQTMAVAASVLALLAGYWLYPAKPAEPCPELLCHLTDDELLYYLERHEGSIQPAKEAAPTENAAFGLSETDLLQAAESME